MGDEGVTDWLATTSGTISGWLGVATGLVITGFALVGDSPIWIPLGLALSLVCWMVLLRPCVGLSTDDLLLRGMVSTVRIPLAAVTSVAVRQVLAVRVGERRFTNPAIGRPLREVRTRRGEAARPNPAVDHLEELIRSRVADARRFARPEAASVPAVTRAWAWPEIACAAILGIAVLTLSLL